MRQLHQRLAERPDTRIALSLRAERISCPATGTTDRGLRAPEVEPGDHRIIRHSAAGHEHLLANDWWPVKPRHTWSRPWSARLTFAIRDQVREDSLLEIDCTVTENPTTGRIDAVIALNGFAIYKAIKPGDYALRLLIASNMFAGAGNCLSFHGWRYCPADYGSHDRRELGRGSRSDLAGLHMSPDPCIKRQNWAFATIQNLEPN